jgi:hypothetical protein
VAPSSEEAPVAVLLGFDVSGDHGCRRRCARPLAFSQRSQGWDIVGAVLTGSAIADVILLVVVAWFNGRRRAPRSRDVGEDQPRPRNTV